ncbi:hypothetical protein [Amycolatopsis anabasis]|uniref:hypothetical protein n=1 Tax=Amycolatopsis anabasis TaxID=1840409 RepID=UPI00131A6F11|nr:hypothetical protein [Amycolatopsis anabasis]
MRNDWIFDAVQAEVAYRTEELRKAGRGSRVVSPKRRWKLPWSRSTEVRIPEQRRGEHEQATVGTAAG